MTGRGLCQVRFAILFSAVADAQAKTGKTVSACAGLFIHVAGTGDLRFCAQTVLQYDSGPVAIRQHAIFAAVGIFLQCAVAITCKSLDDIRLYRHDQVRRQLLRLSLAVRQTDERRQNKKFQQVQDNRWRI